MLFVLVVVYLGKHGNARTATQPASPPAAKARYAGRAWNQPQEVAGRAPENVGRTRQLVGSLTTPTGKAVAFCCFRRFLFALASSLCPLLNLWMPWCRDQSCRHGRFQNHERLDRRERFWGAQRY